MKYSMNGNSEMRVCVVEDYANNALNRWSHTGFKYLLSEVVSAWNYKTQTTLASFK